VQPNEKLDPHGAAAYLNTSRATLARWRVQGGGPPFIKMGGRIRYDVADLDAWLESRRRVSTSDREEPARLTA